MSHPLPRRHFLRAGAGAAVGLLAGTPTRATTPAMRPDARPGRRRQAEPWGRIQRVAPDTWALVSTPRNEHPDARRTLCNGGIIAGRDAVMIIEGFASPAGAAWMAGQAERLTGRRPSHVVITHFHGDHVGGTAGYVHGDRIPAMLATATTRRLLAEQAAAHDSARR
ncbi:MAG: MBL fold metallo-hydrolase, partial [Longimicrobiales bacterium]|nr:MBL fold metallo-hydrolase [Longimicrobiales bacterium]